MALTKEDLQAIRALMQEELKPINTRIESIDIRIESMDARLDKVEDSLQTVRNSQIIVELEQYPRISAALDGVAGEIEKNKEQDNRILVLENKAEDHSNRIWAIEQSVKKAL